MWGQLEDTLNRAHDAGFKIGFVVGVFFGVLANLLITRFIV